MRPLILLVCALFLGSCAVPSTLNPPSRSMAAARAGLAPEYRMFYDALADYGDWMLIEPYGYLFRPRVDYRDWRPYQYGFWAPTDAFGWVWISSEPFGWATFHYGRWFYDSFQGWVWQPGVQWAPAWVSWQMNDSYVGWAPLSPGIDGREGTIPGGRYLFTGLQNMGATDLHARVVSQAELGAKVSNAQPVNETEVVDGATVPVGPAISRIERAIGQPLARVRVDNLLTDAFGRQDKAEAPSPAAPAPAGEADATQATRRAAEQATREARVMSNRGGRAPSRIPIVKPAVEARRDPLPRMAPAARDSARGKRGG